MSKERLSKKELTDKQDKRHSKRKQKKNIVVGLNCGKVTAGYPSGRKSRSSKRHPRTSNTKSNKLRKLKSIYNRIFRHSVKAKKEDKSKKKEYFCDKYPTVESYLKNYPLKEVGVASKSGPTVSSERKKELKNKFGSGGLLGNY